MDPVLPAAERGRKGAGADKMVACPVAMIAVILPVPVAACALRGRAQHACLGALARQAVLQSSRQSALALEELNQTADGAPVPWRGVHWSLSHKPDRVAGIAAPVPVGIDLEILRPVAAGMYAKIGTDAEWTLLEEEGPDVFFRLWTAKEAVLKAAGEGLRGLGACRLAAVDGDCLGLIHRESAWTVRQCRRGDSRVAVAAGVDFRVDWRFAADGISAF